MTRPDAFVARIRRRVADAMPAPLAAPETPRLRRLRLWLLVCLMAIAALTVLMPAFAGRMLLAAALAWQGFALAGVIVGIVWLRAKTRADDAWLSRQDD